MIFDHEPPIAGSEVVFRLVGVSFATCGLIAWRRRPDSDVGRLMTGAGFGIFVYPLASQVDSAFVVTIATLFASVWMIAFTALILSFVTGGRLETPVDRLLVAASFFALFVLQFVRMLFADYPDNVLLVVRGQLDVFTALGDIQFEHQHRRVGRHRGRDRHALAAGVAAAPASAASKRRRLPVLGHVLGPAPELPRDPDRSPSG